MWIQTCQSYNLKDIDPLAVPVSSGASIAECEVLKTMHKTSPLTMVLNGNTEIPVAYTGRPLPVYATQANFTPSLRLNQQTNMPATSGYQFTYSDTITVLVTQPETTLSLHLSRYCVGPSLPVYDPAKMLPTSPEATRVRTEAVAALEGLQKESYRISTRPLLSVQLLAE